MLGKGAALLGPKHSCSAKQSGTLACQCKAYPIQAGCAPSQASTLIVQVLEELEGLGSECARAVTRLRARLAPERQAALDGAAAALSPAFDLQAALVPEALLLQECCRSLGPAPKVARAF